MRCHFCAPLQGANRDKCPAPGARCALAPDLPSLTPWGRSRTAVCYLLLQFSIDEPIDLVSRGAYALRQSDNTSVCRRFRQRLPPSSHDKLRFVGPEPGSYRFEDGRSPMTPSPPTVTAMLRD